MAFLPRLFQSPQQSFFLFGPRGTGKSLLMRTVYPDALWIDLLQSETLRAYESRPERLRELVQAHPEKKVIVIDEVQQVPALLQEVHILIEKKMGLLFVLTGSSARKLKRTSANLLAGRALNRQMYPFMAAELGQHFNLDSALCTGMLPLVFGSPNPIDLLQTYIGLYLKEEIQMEGLVRRLDNFSRFLEVISFSHGGQLNVSNIARECEVKRGTVENYIEILKDLLLACEVPVFTKRAQRELSTHPKFYLFDAGVFRTLRPKGPLDSVEEMNGAALEGLVAQHLQAWNAYSAEKHELSFWRTRSGVEVDFVLYGPMGFWALEVKNSTKVHLADIKSLEAFLVDYPMATAILLYRGTERLLLKEKIWCLPCDQFLLALIPNKPLL